MIQSTCCQVVKSLSSLVIFKRELPYTIGYISCLFCGFFLVIYLCLLLQIMLACFFFKEGDVHHTSISLGLLDLSWHISYLSLFWILCSLMAVQIKKIAASYEWFCWSTKSSTCYLQQVFQHCSTWKPSNLRMVK